MRKCDSTYSTCKPVEGGRACDPVYYGPHWAKDSRALMANRICMRAPNSLKPNYGFTNFDNIGYGVLTVFTSITLEGWTDVMYMLFDTFGRGYIVVPYFILLILFGSFFLVNLALAVIWQEYEKTSREEKEQVVLKQMARNARRRQRKSKNVWLGKQNYGAYAVLKACSHDSPCSTSVVWAFITFSLF